MLRGIVIVVIRGMSLNFFRGENKFFLEGSKDLGKKRESFLERSRSFLVFFLYSFSVIGIVISRIMMVDSTCSCALRVRRWFSDLRVSI